MYAVMTMNAQNTPIDFQSPTPLFQQIKSLILGQISRGELRPHDQIPSERAYEQQFGISRQTIRRALEELRLTRVLYRIPGKGTYVAEQPPAALPMRVIGSTTFFADMGDHKNRTLAIERRSCPPFVALLLGMQERTDIVFIEQIEITPVEPRLVHRAYIPMDVGQPILKRQHIDVSVLNLLVNVCGKRPARSRDRLVSGLANEHDAELLDISPGSSTQVLRGVITASDGTLLEAHEAVVRGDRFKLDFEFDIDLLRALNHEQDREEG
jgi:GntR family transcriptional regulator